MTRPLHVETDVQRATSADAVSEAERERGYEPSDVPAGKAALGLLALLGLVVVALLFCWAELHRLAATHEPRHPPFSAVRAPPPEPRLLTGPIPALRERVPPVTDERITDERITGAMKDVARRGWGDPQPQPQPQPQPRPRPQPPPSEAETARAHRKAVER